MHRPGEVYLCGAAAELGLALGNLINGNLFGALFAVAWAVPLGLWGFQERKRS